MFPLYRKSDVNIREEIFTQTIQRKRRSSIVTQHSFHAWPSHWRTWLPLPSTLAVTRCLGPFRCIKDVFVKNAAAECHYNFQTVGEKSQKTRELTGFHGLPKAAWLVDWGWLIDYRSFIRRRLSRCLFAGVIFSDFKTQFPHDMIQDSCRTHVIVSRKQMCGYAVRWLGESLAAREEGSRVDLIKGCSNWGKESPSRRTVEEDEMEWSVTSPWSFVEMFP